ncbi:hypothetical protein NVP1244A_192 [Vibrio phage 1.244.A._10N.261.54.C3]|nr:hypothetical protein NVP1244A_192 [Vibrio phage 1.244.A._10N.261.54.C3]AUR98820.1 hypothetical protein NVP1255O_192 [Vibrio phage 1.255.O._10N.286.45.F1]
MENIIQLFTEKFGDVDLEKLNKYVKFCQENVYDGCDEYSEEHHILLKRHFPEYKTDAWNIVRLKYDDHVEAHRLLYMVLPKLRAAFYAYFMLKSNTRDGIDSDIRAENVKWLTGDNNPAKNPEVRAKISARGV